MRKTSPGSPLSARPVICSTTASLRRESIGRGSTSQTPSNTSNGCRAGRGGSIANPARSRSKPAFRGWRRRSPQSNLEHRRAGSNRGTGSIRKSGSRDPGSQPAGDVDIGAACLRHRASLGTAARSGRGDPPSRNLALYRRSATGCGAIEMIGRIPSGSIGAWIVLALASVAVLAVALVVAELWIGIGASEISLAGALAMIFGVVVALALGIGLMSLVFLSSRRGYDEAARRDH